MPSKDLRLTKTVVMVGMMGAGKTAIGKALARRVGVAFLDSDEEIVKAANMSIAEIFERDGEPFFRARESEIIGRLLHGEPTILSTGGGAFLTAENRELIAKDGVSVWLKADLQLLWSRVQHKTTRPLLRTGNPFQTLKEIEAKRRDIYAQAILTVEAQSEFSIEDMTDKVLATLIEANIVERVSA